MRQPDRHAVWLDITSDEDLAALNPGIPPDLDRRPDVLVIGGGIVGLATAEACRRRGIESVVVLERDHIAFGASGGAGAILTPDPHVWLDSPEFVALGRSSLDRYLALDGEWAGELGVEQIDVLIPLPFALDDEKATELGDNYADAERVAGIEPALGETPSAFYARRQARANPLQVCAALARRAGQVATGVEVGDFTIESGRITKVATSLGDFHPDSIVYATGLAPASLVALPQSLIKGHLVATAPVHFKLKTIITAPEVLVVQLPDGRLIAGGTVDEGDDEDIVRHEIIDFIRSEITQLLPGIVGVELLHQWCCFRPKIGRGEPVIDRVPEIENAWLNVGHFRTGILMAPAAGLAIADWISSGGAPESISTFTVERARSASGRN